MYGATDVGEVDRGFAAWTTLLILLDGFCGTTEVVPFQNRDLIGGSLAL
jgi:hypothetical protein